MYIDKVNGKSVKLDALRISNSLMYVLKSLSGDSENDIVTYFYEMGISMFNDAVSKKRLPQRCTRKVKIFYKNTGVCVKFEVWSSYFNSVYNSGRDINVHMSAGHIVNDWVQIRGDKIDNMLSETGLGLGDDLVVKANRPVEKKYRFQKKQEAQQSGVKEINWNDLPPELKLKFKT